MIRKKTITKSFREPQQRSPSGIDRRCFLGRMVSGAAATLAAVTLADPSGAFEQFQEVSSIRITEVPPTRATHKRIIKAFELRRNEAVRDARVPAGINISNGDEARYADKGGTYTKGLLHDSFGRVVPVSFTSFKKALNSGKFSDFESIITGGGPHTLNGPQGALTFNLDGLDEVQFGQPEVPPAPPVASDQNATELLELYWGSLLRDVAFTDYGSSWLAAQAATELGAQPTYQGPRDIYGHVTPDLLFRGPFTGEELGPYVSQFFLQPTSFGTQPLGQQMESYLPDIDYMTNFNDWLTVQNGFFTGQQDQVEMQLRYLRNGRDLAAYCHVDVLFQAYFTAFLVLAGIGASVNPGNPYIGSKTQNGFVSFGLPDFAATICEIATRALCAAWYQKWMVHLRPRPEEVGGRVHLIMTGQGDKTNITLSKVILSSNGLQQSFNKYGTWLLSQAYPEGSPVHPAYPTGHGTVAGACITILKFFFDGAQKIRPILIDAGRDVVVPSSDGLSLNTYMGADRDNLDINGELVKMAHNVTFGHGIHSGIHWRSDSDKALLLGEAVALAYLRDRARIYNEPFTIRLMKIDGTTATISNVGNP